MYNSAFFKFTAREKLKNCYFVAVIGALICMLPVYIRQLISSMFNYELLAGRLIAEGIGLVIELFAINLFMIGFIKMLMELNPSGEKPRDKCRYDLIVYSYRSNFKNALKITVLRELKIFLWALIVFIPAAIAIFAVKLFVPLDSLKGLVSVLSDFSLNQTEENLAAAQEFINLYFPHLHMYSLIYLAATVAASIPLIYKSYQYAMIPMILADNPDIKSKAAFKRTKDIMDGFRFRYFFIQLSFFVYIMLAGLILLYSGSVMVYIIAKAVLMPYQYMTYLEFYRQRNSVIEYNVEKYGED
ncbi:MAG: DUF975 family protein [Oscillospiraceae bacterium]|nr:DUF975 family protein [Oscillospiraceae bacterium]